MTQHEDFYPMIIALGLAIGIVAYVITQGIGL